VSKTSANGVVEALNANAEQVLADWIESFESSPLRFPSPVDRPTLTSLVDPAFRALADALSTGLEQAAPGSHRLREAERLFAFVGASLASASVSSRQSSAFDASALGAALRDALCRQTRDAAEERSLQPLCDWLTAVLAESFAAAGRQGERERFHELLEDRVSVVAISPSVAAALAIGDAECGALASALERLVVQVARIGASAVIIDVTSLDGAKMPHNLQALETFLSHSKVGGAVRIAAVGLSSAAALEWGRCATARGVDVELFDSFLQASVWAHGAQSSPDGRGGTAN